MKRQEICERTGLTPKALRLYEEKGLIAPATIREGRNHMREYSQEDLARLQMIATLRRAMFTITEIKEMLDNPEAIQTIFPQYLTWLREQSRQISQLLAASEQVDLTAVASAADLTKQIERAASELPIPASDIRFRFRQLDALEAQRPSFTTEQKLNQLLPGDAAYRSSVVAISRDKLDNTLAFNSQLNDTRSMPTAESRGVADQKVRLKRWQRLIRWALNLLIVLGLWVWWESYFAAWPLLLLLPAALLRAFLAWKDHRAGQRQWADRMGWAADFSVNRKKILKITGLVVLALALVVGIFVGITALIWPVEPAGGPSTEGLDMEEFFRDMPGQLFHVHADTMGDEWGGKFPDAYAVAPDKVYFAFGVTLYSINADYTGLTKIDSGVYAEKGAKSAVVDILEKPCDLIYHDGHIYYLAAQKERFGRYAGHLMCHETGAKIRPKDLARPPHSSVEAEQFSALGLSADGQIILYHRETGGHWYELARIDPPDVRVDPPDGA